MPGQLKVRFHCFNRKNVYGNLYNFVFFYAFFTLNYLDLTFKWPADDIIED